MQNRGSVLLAVAIGAVVPYLRTTLTSPHRDAVP
jgi:hypothetical protein